MPAYHRFDVTFNFSHTTRRGRLATWSVGVYNLYNRANPFYMDVNGRGILEDRNNFRSRFIGVNNTLRVGSFLPVLPFVSYTKRIK
jgi:hypothetical protein